MSTTLVAGRYELLRPLGHGAMAVVDLAEDVELGRQVALKQLAENLARDADLRRRFVREGRLAASLSHPNVVRVFDVGEEGGRPFIAMEYVEGETLAELLARRDRLPAAEAAALGVQACSALAAAHAAGLVHRDVKPQNLLLSTDGTLKLGDFGIAFGPEGTQLTLAGTVLGTVGYLAPEQARGERVTAAADIYSLGAVLYELSTGAPPSRDGALRPPGLAPEFARVVASCLAPRPEDRPASAAALARDLAAVASEAATLQLPDDPSRRATEILAPPMRPHRAAGGRRLVAVVALVAAAAVGLAIAVLATRGGASPRHTRSTPAAVRPVPTGADGARQAVNVAAWLRRYTG